MSSNLAKKYENLGNLWKQYNIKNHEIKYQDGVFNKQNKENQDRYNILINSQAMKIKHCKKFNEYLDLRGKYKK